MKIFLFVLKYFYERKIGYIACEKWVLFEQTKGERSDKGEFYAVYGHLDRRGFVSVDRSVSSILAGVGMSCLWSILELFEQEERVKKGWFPANPKRKKDHQ